MTDAHLRLQLARAKAGFDNPTDAARRFGWPEVTYRSHENGERGITRAAAKYAKAFKVSAAWLLTGEGEPGFGGVGSVPDELLQSAWEASFHTLGIPDTEAKAAAVELLAYLRGDIIPARGLTVAQAVEQKVTDLIQRYAPITTQKSFPKRA